MSKAIPALRDQQYADLVFYYTEPRGANLSDPGTGKTPPTCVYTWARVTQEDIRAVWVQPKSLIRKNIRELLTFTAFEPDDIVNLDCPAPMRAKRIKQGGKVFMMTAEGLSRHGQELKILYPNLKMLIIDEWHMVYKGPTSTRTQAMVRFARDLDYIVPMTGTMIDGRLDTAYAWIQLVNPGYYGSYEAFMNYHAIRDENDRVLAWKNTEKLSQIFGRHAIRHTFEETYGKVEEVILPELVEMSPLQREWYDQLHEQALLELENDFIDVSEPGSAFMRARQIMEHPEAVPIHDTVPAPGTKKGVKRIVREWVDLMKGDLCGKDARLLVHLEDHKRTRKPGLIFAAFQRQQERLVKLVQSQGFRVGLINGNVSSNERDRVDKAFVAGELDWIVASPQTASVGYNWQFWGPKQQEVDDVYFLSIDCMDTSFVQAKARPTRKQRLRPLRVVVFQYEDSLDQRVISIVEGKSALAAKVDASRSQLEIGVKKKEEEKRPNRQRPPGPMRLDDFLAF